MADHKALMKAIIEDDLDINRPSPVPMHQKVDKRVAHSVTMDNLPTLEEQHLSEVYSFLEFLGYKVRQDTAWIRAGHMDDVIVFPDGDWVRFTTIRSETNKSPGVIRYATVANVSVDGVVNQVSLKRHTVPNVPTITKSDPVEVPSDIIESARARKETLQ